VVWIALDEQSTFHQTSSGIWWDVLTPWGIANKKLTPIYHTCMGLDVS
jgi:hypothetical protein